MKTNLNNLADHDTWEYEELPAGQIPLDQNGNCKSVNPPMKAGYTIKMGEHNDYKEAKPRPY